MATNAEIEREIKRLENILRRRGGPKTKHKEPLKLRLKKGQTLTLILSAKPH